MFTPQCLILGAHYLLFAIHHLLPTTYDWQLNAYCLQPTTCTHRLQYILDHGLFGRYSLLPLVSDHSLLTRNVPTCRTLLPASCFRQESKTCYVIAMRLRYDCYHVPRTPSCRSQRVGTKTSPVSEMWLGSRGPAYYSLLTTTTYYYSLLTTYYSLLLTTYYYLPLTTTYSLLLTAYYWLLTTYYSLLTTHYSLLTTYYLLPHTYDRLRATYRSRVTGSGTQRKYGFMLEQPYNKRVSEVLAM